ncbi:thiamine phosphate synthase [Parvibaculum sp.]|uniref:thiamine phosphate synthase n=1 Tax=Parvibaculum sp. TaxID=2024848 RepID=UPI002D0B8D81|nr:thiamine phosphate synthase [Parvibaculum sp.]HUD52430.1 thiamine phosphate synthase [Parvibaculum sp.]
MTKSFPRDAEAKLGKRRNRCKAGLPFAIAMTDPLRRPDPAEALRRAPKGSAVIYRAYGVAHDDARLRELARLARLRGVLLLVAGDLKAGSCLGIGGLHLPEYLIRQSAEQRFARPARRKPDLVVTAAAHSQAAITAAARAGVDAVLISPVFATRSHPDARPLGVVRFAALASCARTHGLAVYALGGATGERARRRLAGVRLHGVAGIGASATRPS